MNALRVAALALAAAAVVSGCSGKSSASSDATAASTATTAAASVAATSDATTLSAIASATPEATAVAVAGASAMPSPAIAASALETGSAAAAPAPSAAATWTTTTSTAESTLTTAIVPPETTFDVAWKPETKVIDAPTIQSAYRGIGDDGSMVFDGGAAPIAALQPNTVVMLSGLALRRVVRVDHVGSDLHVFTGPAALNDAIANGHIAFKLPVDFTRVAFAPPPGFHDADAPGLAESPWNQPLFDAASADEPGFHYAGTVKDWDVDLKITPQNGDLHIDLDAKKDVGGGQIDIHGIGELDSLTSAANIVLSDGETTQIAFDNSNLHGKLDMTWKVAFDKSHGGDQMKVLDEPEVSNLPLGFSLPFVVGPLPLKLMFKTGFAFEPAFTGAVTVAQGEYHTSFGGAVSVDAGGTAPAPSMEGDGSIDTTGGTLSLAPLGLSATLQLPKIVLTLGVPDALDNIVGEIKGLGLGDIARSDPLAVAPSAFKGLMGESEAGPYVSLMTQINFIATGPNSMVACERRDLKVMVFVGLSTSLFGHDIAAIPSKNVYEHDTSLVLPPNIHMCQQQ